MTMKRLIEDLQGHTTRALTEAADPGTPEGDAVDAEGDYVDPEYEGEPAGDPETLAADAFAGWAEGVAVVATVDTEAMGEEDGEEVTYEIPADTTAEVLAIITDMDPPGAVVTLDDGTEVAILLDMAGDWGLAGEGAEGSDEEVAVADDEEDDDEEDDEEDMDEGTDPLVRSLRAILDEGRKGAKKADKKAPKGCDGKGPKGMMGKGKGQMAEVEEVAPATQATLALVGVYGQLLTDVIAALGTADLGALGAERVGLEVTAFLRKARPAMRKAGVSPSLVQRLLPKVAAKVDAVVGAAIRDPQALAAE